MITEIEQIQNLVIALLAGVILIRVLDAAVSAPKARTQKQVLTTIGVFNGLAIEIGFSPMQSFAGELTLLSSVIPGSYPHLIGTIASVGTAFALIWGVGTMIERSGKIGAAAFLLAFVSGMMLPYQDTILLGGVLMVGAVITVDLAPTSQWRSRGL